MQRPVDFWRQAADDQGFGVGCFGIHSFMRFRLEKSLPAKLHLLGRQGGDISSCVPGLRPRLRSVRVLPHILAVHTELVFAVVAHAGILVQAVAVRAPVAIAGEAFPAHLAGLFQAKK